MVSVRYIGAKRSRIFCELQEDDPLAIPPDKAGTRMWWERSIIVKEE